MSAKSTTPAAELVAFDTAQSIVSTLQTAFGTSVQGVLGDVMSKR